jgi:hypothetical protein
LRTIENAAIRATATAMTTVPAVTTTLLSR